MKKYVYWFFIVFFPLLLSWECTTCTCYITASAGTGGSITPSGTVELDRGDSISYVMTPDHGYEIALVNVDDSPVGAVEIYTFLQVTEDHRIDVEFSKITPFIIKASSDKGGSIHPSGDVEVIPGDDKSFSIYPDVGYEIKDVTVNDESKGPLSSYTFSAVKQDGKIHASFNNLNGELKFSSSAENVSEGAGSASFIVRRSGGTKGAVGVSFSTKDGTALDGYDYIGASGTLTWGDGDASIQTIIVTIADDSSLEPNETFTITLSNPQQGAVLGEPSSIEVTILNNDTG